MGQCGCTEVCERYLLDGPAESVYIISLVGACHDCETPAGVFIDRHPLDDAVAKQLEPNLQRIPHVEIPCGVRYTTIQTSERTMNVYDEPYEGAITPRVVQAADAAGRGG